MSTDDDPDPADDRLAAALEAAFPDREVATLDGTGPSWNDRNGTVRVTLADGTTRFLKFARDGDPTRVVRERAALAYVGARTAVPVPTVVASGTEGEVPYLVTAPLAGRPLHEAWDAGSESARADVARSLGRTLATVHGLRFEGHGEVRGGTNEGLVLDRRRWSDLLRDRVDETQVIGSSDRFPDHFDRVRDLICDRRDLLDAAPAALVHGDPALPNGVASQDGGVGLLDWELAHVGDPARDLHRALDQAVGDDDPAADRLRDALRAGYRDRAGSLPTGYESRAPVYDAVRFLGRSGFFDRWVEFRDDDPETLAEEFETEMERRLAAARSDGK
jgi:aminoglycoside phosphotransferase (APT) family kinase protein